jgi:hypothetical protein
MLKVKVIECHQQRTLSLDGLSDLLSSRFFIHKHDLFAVDENGQQAIWLQNYYRMTPPPVLVGKDNVEMSPLAILSLCRKASLDFLKEIQESLNRHKQSIAHIKKAVHVPMGGQVCIEPAHFLLEPSDKDVLMTLVRQGEQGILVLDNIVPRKGDTLTAELFAEKKAIYYHDATALTHDMLAFHLRDHPEDSGHEIHVLIKVQF